MSNTQNGNEEASAPEEVSPKKLGYRRRRAARHARFCSGSFHAAVAHTSLCVSPPQTPLGLKQRKTHARTAPAGRVFPLEKARAKNAKPVAHGGARGTTETKPKTAPNKRMRAKRGTEGGTRGRKSEFQCARKATRSGGCARALQRRRRRAPNARTLANAPMWHPLPRCAPSEQRYNGWEMPLASFPGVKKR